MSENVTTALQVNATTGNGENLFLRERRLVTFKIQGKGPISAGQITIESGPQTSAIVPGSGSAGAVWTALTVIAVPSDSRTTDYVAGWISGTLRARISTPVTGGTVTVLAIRVEEQLGWSRRPSPLASSSG